MMKREERGSESCDPPRHNKSREFVGSSLFRSDFPPIVFDFLLLYEKVIMAHNSSSQTLIPNLLVTLGELRSRLDKIETSHNRILNGLSLVHDSIDQLASKQKTLGYFGLSQDLYRISRSIASLHRPQDHLDRATQKSLEHMPNEILLLIAERVGQDELVRNLERPDIISGVNSKSVWI